MRLYAFHSCAKSSVCSKINTSAPVNASRMLERRTLGS